MSFRVKSGLLLSVYALAACGVVSTASAQTDASSGTGVGSNDSGQLQEIVVHAQRRDENLENVPISIQAFDNSRLESAQIVESSDLPVLTPGLVMGNDAGYATPFLRGIGTAAEGPGVESPIATYVDGVYYGALVGSILSLASVSQIEVDKGPQGTLFGRNATGGLIQITTRDPSSETGGFVNATYGNYQTAGAELYATAPVTSNLATNLAVYFRDQLQGYGRNLGNGQDVDLSEDVVIRNKWLFSPSAATQLKVTLDYELTDFVPAISSAAGTLPLGPPPFTIPPHDVAGLYQPFGRSALGGASFQVHHDADFAQFVSLTAYRYVDNAVQGEPLETINPQFAVSGIPAERHDQYTQEFQLLAPANSRIQWTTGLYLLYSDNRFPTPGVWVTGGAIAPLASLSYVSQTKIYALAPYAQATMEVAPQTDLTLGIRYNAEKHDFNGSQNLGFPGGTSLITTDQASERFEKPTWRFAVDHHFTSDLMGYVSYNRGFKSGGFNDSNIPTVAYAPETIDAYELGTKITPFDRRLSLNLAAFLYNYKNVQEISFAQSSAQPLIYNAATARIYGLDLDAKWRISQSLSLTGAMEYLHARFTSFPDAPLSSPMPGGGTAFVEGSAAGNTMPYAPDWSSSLTLDYTIPLMERGELTVGVTYAYSDGYFSDPDNRLRQAPYNLVNSQIAWNSPAKNWNVRLWGRNLTNAVYTQFFGAEAIGDEAAYSPPRTYGITARRNF